MMQSPQYVLTYLAFACVAIILSCGGILTLKAGIAESSLVRGWLRLWMVAMLLLAGMFFINVMIGQVSLVSMLS